LHYSGNGTSLCTAAILSVNLLPTREVLLFFIIAASQAIVCIGWHGLEGFVN